MTRPTIYPIELAHRIAARRREGWTWEKIKVTFGVEAPTARNILANYGLIDEYTPPQDEMWERPCLRCGSKEVRRKGLFRCAGCRRLAATEFNAQDFMYGGVA